MAFRMRFRAAVPPRRALSGEQWLWYAMVCDALDVVAAYPSTHEQVRADLAWIHGAPAPLRFGDLCDGLGLDADAVRETLRNVSRHRTCVTLANPTATCAQCGGTFAPLTAQQRYCSPSHAHVASVRRSRRRHRRRERSARCR